MNALVTGGGGFIGSALARRLLARGDFVRVLDNLSTGRKENVPSDAELFVGDVRELSDVAAAVEGADIVFHQAALGSVPRSLAQPELVHACNATGTLNVLLAAEAASVRRVVYASSSSIYGGSSDQPNREGDAPNPLSPYAVSKLSGEMYVRTWSRLDRLSTVTLRYFNVFGPGQSAVSTYAAVFPAFISAVAEGKQPRIFGDGHQKRDFTFVEDVVSANLAAAEASGPEVEGQVFNIAGGQPRTVNEVLEAICEELDRPVDPVRLEARPGDVRDSSADIKKAASVLGWRPETGWGDAVSLTVRGIAA